MQAYILDINNQFICEPCKILTNECNGGSCILMNMLNMAFANVMWGKLFRKLGITISYKFTNL